VTEITQDDVEAGAASYTTGLLAAYDFLVLRITSRFVWRCPSERLLDHYNRHISDNHLDVGPGTGYFLDRCQFGSAKPHIALLDLNPNCLDVASRRIGRYAPAVYRASVLDPINIDGPGFDSVGLNYVLHCLPGTIRTKSTALEHLAAVLNPGGTLFGSTVLYGEVPKTWVARHLMESYNERKAFTNMDDDLSGLRWALSQHLSNVSIDVVGSVALFSAQKDVLGA
jgi:ubiquinone/menaquinone biosynthesis C-methylase UbiE